MLHSKCARYGVRSFRVVTSSLQTRWLSSLQASSRLTASPAWSSSLNPSSSNCSASFTSQRRYYADTVIKVPEMAESISEGTLKQWSKGVGDYVERDEEVATIETDKIDVSVNAPDAGTISEILAKEEDTVTVGQEIAKMSAGGAPDSGKQEASKEGQKQEKSSEQGSPEPQQQTQQSQPKEEAKTKSQERKEPAPSQQTQPLQQQQQQQPQQPPSPPQQQKKPQEQPKEDVQRSKDSALGNREERRVKMNRMRLRIAERLKQSQNTAASLTTFQKVDMHSLMEFRKAYKDEILKKTGVKLGFMSAFTKASILAMKDVPTVNASIEGPDGGDTIVYRDYVDVSVAVATEKGLVTPVVRNAESLDLIGIEKAIADLGRKARDNKLTIEDMAGGTFTISNGGVFGSLFGTPIINLPQTAVLGLHAINDEVVVVDGKFEARPIMYLALTYDHRLLDGREAVTFLVKIKEYIQDPRRMLLA